MCDCEDVSRETDGLRNPSFFDTFFGSIILGFFCGFIFLVSSFFLFLLRF